jgi:site-specific DNA-cytosine methylase
MLNNHVTYPLSKNDMLMVKSIPTGGNWKNIPLSIPSERLKKIRKTGGRTTLYGRLKWGAPSYTITTYFNRPGNGTYIHPDKDRVISAREAARLQSFPDDYIFYGSKTSFCKQIGNAVPPLLAYSIAQKIKEKYKIKNSIDLFCGAGGLSKGFEWAGINVVAANDNFSAACLTYKLNNPNTVLIEGDITNIDTKNKLFQSIKNKKIDIIVGGPPCQGFSHAGKRLIDDPRNSLYKEFVEIVKKIKPPVILLENVEGIITINNGKTFQSIKENFSALGYKMHGEKIHAVKFGVPQKRKRVIIIGVKKGNPRDCFPKSILEEDKFITVKDAIGNLSNINCNENSLKIVIKPQGIYQKFLSGVIKPSDFLKNII